MKVEPYEIRIEVSEDSKCAYFTDKHEAESFVKSVKNTIKKYGVKAMFDIWKETTADGKDLYGVGELFLNLTSPVSSSNGFISKDSASWEA